MDDFCLNVEAGSIELLGTLPKNGIASLHIDNVGRNETPVQVGTEIGSDGYMCITLKLNAENLESLGNAALALAQEFKEEGV